MNLKSLQEDPRCRGAALDLGHIITDAVDAVESGRPRETLEHYINQIERLYKATFQVEPAEKLAEVLAARHLKQVV